VAEIAPLQLDEIYIKIIQVFVVFLVASLQLNGLMETFSGYFKGKILGGHPTMPVIHCDGHREYQKSSF
jgi:hypothetical protein